MDKSDGVEKELEHEKGLRVYYQQQLATVTAERDVALEVLNKVEDAVTWLADDWRSVSWDNEAGYFYVSDLSKILAENDWENNPGQLPLNAFIEAIEKSKAMQESEAGAKWELKS